MNVLFIVPNFPPINAPDAHRIRHFMQYKPEGMNCTVLAMEPDEVPYPQDKFLLGGIPTDLHIIRVRPLGLSLLRTLGLRNRINESLRSFYRAIKLQHEKKKIDLIVVSTTLYPVTLSAWWARYRLRIPYIVDLQDPWRSDHYLKLPRSKRPPKFWISYLIDSILERIVCKSALGFISVNADYIKTIVNRYHLSDRNQLVLPFSVSERDKQLMQSFEGTYQLAGATTNVVYTGRLNRSMHDSIAHFLQLIRLYNGSGPSKKVVFHLFGTSYVTPADSESNIDYLIDQFQVREYVRHSPQRIGYFDSLSLMKQADFFFIPASNDLQYNPSKLANVLSMGSAIISMHQAIPIEGNGSKILRLKVDDLVQSNFEKMNAFMQFNHDRESFLPKELEMFDAAVQSKQMEAFFNTSLNSEKS